ncbi:hypothetical protein BJ165DRAFT_1358886 [Panaeolus papilionaceus]|nr:hypothetical protein BJ165DRAFT_1358886 [Panaeolus papilionaceus]
MRWEPSWIWLISNGGNADEEGISNEQIRAEWAKARARMMRWREEYLLVQEEMRCVLAWLEYKVAWWEQSATQRLQDKCDPSVLHGVVAYAYKQAYICWQMASRYAVDWLLVLLPIGIEPSWGHSFYPSTGLGTHVVASVGVAQGEDLDEEENGEDCRSSDEDNDKSDVEGQSDDECFSDDEE